MNITQITAALPRQIKFIEICEIDDTTWNSTNHSIVAKIKSIENCVLVDSGRKAAEGILPH